jgi:predicted nucleotidyltransferase
VTPESLRLRELAHRIVAAVVPSTGAAGALLTGSAGEGSADRFSDLDLLFYYERLPEPAAFRQVLDGLGAAYLLPIGEATEESFADAYLMDGVQVQTGGSAVSNVERQLDRVLAGTEPGEPSTKLAMGLLHGLPLHGDELLRRWRERAAAYPDELARRTIEKHLAVFPYWRAVEHMAARDARLWEVQSLLDGAFAVLAVLSGLNRVYFTTFQFKRMRQHVAAFEAAPSRLAERLESLFDLDPARAAEELRTLFDETLALVEARMPEVDAARARALGGPRPH